MRYFKALAQNNLTTYLCSQQDLHLIPETLTKILEISEQEYTQAVAQLSLFGSLHEGGELQ